MGLEFARAGRRLWESVYWRYLFPAIRLGDNVIGFFGRFVERKLGLFELLRLLFALAGAIRIVGAYHAVARATADTEFLGPGRPRFKKPIHHCLALPLLPV